MYTFWILMIAVLGDFVWGDPGGRFHPVALIGRLITFMENILYKKETTSFKLFLRGVVASLAVMTCVGFIIIIIITYIKGVYAIILQGVILSFAISARTLIKRGTEIAEDLLSDNIQSARHKLSYIVSRDTKTLQRGEIIRGTVETMAENFIDGIVAPLFWFLLFGLPGAYIYRVSNTLDAMYGYRNDRYEYFGKFSAKTDDVLNYIPARIGGIVLLVTGVFYGLSPVKALKIWLRDAKAHPSPNAGIPESIIASHLGVRLGGYNYYGDKKHFRAYLGTEIKPFEINDIFILRKILYLATALYSVVLIIILLSGRLPWII